MPKEEIVQKPVKKDDFDLWAENLDERNRKLAYQYRDDIEKLPPENRLDNLDYLLRFKNLE